jgi:hypothetical protein
MVIFYSFVSLPEGIWQQTLLSLQPSWDMLASPKPDRDAAMNEYHLFWKYRFNTLQQLLCVSEKKYPRI